MNTIENNKLIAEFMGVNYDPDKPRAFINGQWRLPKVEYHTSWDWLMPVVGKITNDYHRFMTKTDEGQHWTEIWCYEDGIAVHEIECPEDKTGTSISSVYAAVLEFIKWYNKNKN